MERSIALAYGLIRLYYLRKSEGTICVSLSLVTARWQSTPWRRLAARQARRLPCVLATPILKQSSRDSPHSALRLASAYFATQNINDAEIVAAMREVSPDYLVSVNNFQIFRTPSLTVPRLGVLNFHNGPLPRYGGLNACSWALFNGEREHGVTWHLVEGDIDSGPILKQSRFAIGPEETAIGLVSHCIKAGGALLRPLAVELVAGKVQATRQDEKDRLYFGSKDRPWNGDLPWWRAAADVKRVARALSFHPMPNMFYRPRFAFDIAKPLFAEQVEVFDSQPHGEPGTVAKVLDDEVSISLADCVVKLRGIYDSSGRPLAPQDISETYGLRRGGQLSSFGNRAQK